MMEQSLIPQAPALPLTAQRTVKRALTLLDRHLRETGVAFTSTQAARDWLKLKMAGARRVYGAVPESAEPIDCP